jgi:TadE-like protein
MVELALVAPLFLLVVIGIIVLGIGVFYQQQVTNVAREGARYAAIHSATARCPTVSNLPPAPALLPVPNSFWECDKPADRWPRMTAAAKAKLFGINADAVQIAACWSGYWVKDTAGNYPADGYDQLAIDPVSGAPNDLRECSVEVYGWLPGDNPSSDPSAPRAINPRTSQDASGQKVRVDCTKQFPLTSAANDMASSYAASSGLTANRVTVLACYAWQPPLAGFLLIPRTTNIVAVVTEVLEYQQ